MDSFQPVSLTMADGSTYEHQGHIDVISRIVDKGTGAVSVRAVFDNPDGRLMSGGSGRVNVSYDRTGCIVIPQEATYEIQDKIFVYKVIDGVESGLSEGDVIVSEGAGLLREGTPITGTPVNSNEGE